MPFVRIMIGLALTVSPLALHASNVAVTVDDSAARAVLDAVLNPSLTLRDALPIARLPGNQGLIRKAHRYGRPADDDLFARALVAAAHQDRSYQDSSKFHFDDVRAHAAQTKQVLAALDNPTLHLLEAAEKRIAMFTPQDLSGKATGFLVVGGTSGGFAFGDPEFFLNLQFFPSAVLASTIMEHELFHAVQGKAKSAHKPTATALACVAQKSGGENIENLFNALSMEGTASKVGDELALPIQGEDEPTAKERAEFAQNVELVKLHVTELELSVHGLATRAAVTYDEVYAAGFYGNQELYGLGYVMARAIAQEEGNAAISQLISESGGSFVIRYIHLKNYGRSDALPALGRETELWAQQLTACSARTEQK